jgi:hypothetical protein
VRCHHTERGRLSLRLEGRSDQCWPRPSDALDEAREQTTRLLDTDEADPIPSPALALDRCLLSPPRQRRSQPEPSPPTMNATYRSLTDDPA